MSLHAKIMIRCIRQLSTDVDITDLLEDFQNSLTK